MPSTLTTAALLALILASCDDGSKDDTGPADDSDADADSDGDSDTDTDADSDADSDADADTDADADPGSCLEGTIDLSTADARLDGVKMEDCTGSALAVGDLDGDGRQDLALGAPCHDAFGAVNAGGVWVSPGLWSGVVDLEAAGHFLTGSLEYMSAGSALAVGDMDGDGQDDLVVGAPSGYGSNPGILYGLPGPVETDLDLASAGGTLEGPGGSQLGRVLALGDLSGDAHLDLVLSAPYTGVEHADGRVYVVEPPLSGTPSLSSALGTVSGSSQGAFGFSLVVADFDGDGVDDLLAGAPLEGGFLKHKTYDGGAWLLPGPLSGDLTDTDGIHLDSSTYWEFAGSTLASGDIDGDGQADALVSGGESSWGAIPGRVYLVLGPITGDLTLSKADGYLEETSSDNGDVSSLSTGNVDADGFDDILVGFWENDLGGRDAGAAFLLYGPVSGTVDLSTSSAILVGEDADDEAGGEGLLWDLQADGFDDVVVSASGVDEGAWDAGAAYVLYAADCKD